jgi:restriction endonuclease S subunit
MASEWQTVALGDLVSVKHGWPFKSELFSEKLTGKPIVVNIGNFRYSGGFRFENTRLKEYVGDYPREYELLPGDMLLVMTCQTSGGEILGIPGKIPRDMRVYLHNQRLGKVIVKQPKLVHPDFLYWLFLSPTFNADLVTSASGTKILHTSPTRIESFRFSLPPLSEQRAIANMLGSLDDKIELNRRMNETLENLAQALFKSWFVVFDPVRAKSEGCDTGLPEHLTALFPDSFSDLELAKIPNGWLVGKLSDVLSVIETGGRPKGGIKDFTEGVPSVGAESIGGIGHFDYSKTRFVPREFFEGMKKGHVQHLDVLLYKDGGRPGVYEPHLTIVGESQSDRVSSHASSLSPTSPWPLCELLPCAV